MYFTKYFIMLCFAVTITLPQMHTTATSECTLEWYKLEVDRLRLLLQMDATALRIHYKQKMENIYAQCEKRLEAAEVTINMQRSIIKHMQQHFK